MQSLGFGFQGAGTDDEVLIEILASRTGEQLKEITKVYKKGELEQPLFMFDNNNILNNNNNCFYSLLSGNERIVTLISRLVERGKIDSLINSEHDLTENCLVLKCLFTCFCTESMNLNQAMQQSV